MGNYKRGGWELKYIITKTNGKPTDPKADYFVLRLDTDPHAIVAAKAYAKSVKKINWTLSDDLIKRTQLYKKETFWEFIKTPFLWGVSIWGLATIIWLMFLEIIKRW
jgi:hypothetical protein